MGRHTRKLDRGSEADADKIRPGRNRWLGKMPLLPAIAGVLAIGAIVSAVSTKQISLNFAGGTPANAPSPSVTGSARPHPNHGRRTARDGSSLSSRSSRGAARAPVTVTFRRISLTATGFRGQATIVNRGAKTINGWRLAFRYPATKIIAASGVTLVRTGVTFIATNPPSRPSIPPGRSVRVTFTAQGTGRAPSACRFNGGPCRP